MVILMVYSGFEGLLNVDYCVFKGSLSVGARELSAGEWQVVFPDSLGRCVG